MLGSVTKRDEFVQGLGKFISAKLRLEALFSERQEQAQALSKAESSHGAAALVADLTKKAAEIQDAYFLAEDSFEEVTAAKRQLENAKAAFCQQDERLLALRASLRETEDVLAKTREGLSVLHGTLKGLAHDAFRTHFDKEKLWKLNREGEGVWRRRAFIFLYDVLYLNRDGLDELSMLYALQALFAETPFQVRILRGFRIAIAQGDKPPQVLIFNKSEELIDVPARLPFEYAFDEIAQRRAVFIPASGL